MTREQKILCVYPYIPTTPTIFFYKQYRLSTPDCVRDQIAFECHHSSTYTTYYSIYIKETLSLYSFHVYKSDYGKKNLFTFFMFDLYSKTKYIINTLFWRRSKACVFYFYYFFFVIPTVVCWYEFISRYTYTIMQQKLKIPKMIVIIIYVWSGSRYQILQF